MSALELKVYEILKAKLGEKEAEAVLEYFENKTEKKYEEKKETLATKEDLHQLRSEILKVIYLTSLGQLLAIIVSVVTLVLLLKK